MKKKRSLIVLLISILTVCLALSACGGKTQDDPPPAAEYSLDKTAVTLIVGDTHQIKVSSTADDSFTVTYESDTPGAASVSDSGLVTAVAPGTAKIKATVGEKELTVTVTVEHKYELDKTTATLEEGDSVQLAVKTTPNKNVTPVWTVSPAGVVTVSDSGLVTAVAAGKATVTATVDGKTLNCAVTVTESEELYTYSISHTKADIEKGKTLELSLTSEDRDDFDVAWESSDTDIATVSEAGVVTAVAVGKATVEATVDGEVVGECEINVFEYVYTFEKTLTVDYGTDDAAIEVSVAPEKTADYTFAVTEGDAITVDVNGKITVAKVGTATVAIKDGAREVGSCTVTVKAVVDMVKELKMHVGDTETLELIQNPAGSVEYVIFSVTEGEDVVELDDDGVTLTAKANGTAKIKAVADGEEFTCTVTVADVFMTEFAIDVLTMDKENPIDLNDGAIYWEQYISGGEVNHKIYSEVTKDIIDRSEHHEGDCPDHYLSDYKAWLSWSDGADMSTCTCGKCNKSTQNGGDGGWTSGGTKSYCSKVLGTEITLDFKVEAGETTFEVYTGGYNLREKVTIKAGEEILGIKEIDNKSEHKSERVRVIVDVKEATTVTVLLEFVDNYEDSGHSVISLAAARVLGDVYGLAEKSTRLTVGGTKQITVVKNADETAKHVTYSSCNEEVATVDKNGLVTAVADGKAVITVIADGVELHFTVNVGYDYTLNKTSVSLLSGQTHQISLSSDPEGSEETATYTSNDSEIATVSETGLVRAVADGETTITINIGSKTYTLNVVVAKASVTSSREDSRNMFFNLNAQDVLYWEYYLYNSVSYSSEVTPNSDNDLIKDRTESKGGENNWMGSFVLFEGGSTENGSKPNSLSDDGGNEGENARTAFMKYSTGAKMEFDVIVPAGVHEILVFTGAWENTVNKTSLWDGDKELSSQIMQKVSNGTSQLVTFAVTTAEKVTLTLKIEAQVGNNCRLQAIAITDSAAKTQATTTVSMTKQELNGPGSSVVNMSLVGTLDWKMYNIEIPNNGAKNVVEKSNAEYLGDLYYVNSKARGNDQAWDYNAKFTWNDDDSDKKATDCVDGDVTKHNLGNGYHDNGLADDYMFASKVKVNSDVKTITIYGNGYNSKYEVFVFDAKGNEILSEVVFDQTDKGNNAYAITLNVAAATEETLIVGIKKLDGNNIAIAGIAVGDSTAQAQPAPAQVSEA